MSPQQVEAATVVALLRQHAERQPDALAYRFITGLDGRSESLTYRELDARVRSVAAVLQAENLRHKPVLLLHPPGLDYIVNFLACLYAGAIAVPAYPPDAARFGQTLPRLASIGKDANATHALTTEGVGRLAAERHDELAEIGLGGLRWMTDSGHDLSAAASWRDTGCAPGDLAFLQYTSGSTSQPKGVMVSHGNLVANLDTLHRQLGHDSRSVMALWLPPFHDMGLIGGILAALYGGIPLHFMAPMTFVQRPLLWLQTISSTRATTALSPNFGYEHCLRRVSEEQRAELDLSSWKAALNGAEPVRAATLERFADFFEPAGFDRRAFMPAYGLAEATLLVTGRQQGQGSVAERFLSAELEAGWAQPAQADESRAVRVVSCGRPGHAVEVAIVDPQTRHRLPDGRIGEVWVAGPSIARGYWGRPDVTAETFHGRIVGDDDTAYLRTGDLAFMRSGELYVVGRSKDMVVVQGKNYYPPDLEQTVERACEGVLANAGAAFGIELDGAEQLVVVYELDRRPAAGVASLLAKARAAISAEHEIVPHAVVLVTRSSVSRTTSGKIARSACKQDFLTFGMPVVAASVLSAAMEDTADTAGAAGGFGAPVSAAGPRPGRSEVEAVVAAELGAGAAGGGKHTFASLGVDYPRLLGAVRTLERRFGARVPMGDLLARPDTATLTALLLGEDTADEPAATATSQAPAASAPAEVRSPAPERRAQPQRSQQPSPQQRMMARDIQRWLVQQIAGRLGLPEAAVGADLPFTALGLGSQHIVALSDELGRHLGREVPPTLAFDHPTPQALALSLATDETGPAAAASAADAAVETVSRTNPAAATRSGAEPAATAGRERAVAGGRDERDGSVEEIAIVGIGCRFPGSPDADGYWKLLRDGRSAITEVPRERWDVDTEDTPRTGGFLDRIAEFDARFFGISAREAERMDPQQRLLLETAWRTVEDAGIAPTRLAGSRTGVFVGISTHDYFALQMGDTGTVDVHTSTGNSQSIAANRLSYVLDLTGPSIALDTACSSSLVAVHSACQSLRDGECELALAGGVNLILTPELSVAFKRAGMLSPGGVCRSFDDAADGYVRGEGVGMVCLKPLSAALRDGDRIHAVIKGSAIGHGGRSNGLTAPRGSAQRDVIENALAQAGLSAGQVDYVEAHGTGTSLGDPIEWQSLVSVYGRGRTTGEPCLVGSVKSSIGHLEAAAGIAGLIKAALVVRERQVPPQVEFSTPNRRLAWRDSGLMIPTERRTLPVGRPLRAAISSFGFGGANGHLVLETAPDPLPRPEPRVATAPRPLHALCLSGHTPGALATLARDWRMHLATRPDVPLADLCNAADTGRAHFNHRAVLTAADRETLDRGLAALAEGQAVPSVVRGDVTPGQSPRLAFLFSGQGTQYAGMGKALHDAHPAVAESLADSDRVLRPLLGVGLDELLFSPSGAERLGRTRYSQPALVALEIALARLWTVMGVQPTALLGHSVGALSAACVSGVLAQADALELAAARGAAMEAQPGDGTMIACAGDPDRILAAAGSRPDVSVAAINAPEHLVLSGPERTLRQLAEELEAASVTVRTLQVSHAFHSAMMEGAAPALRAAAASVRHATPELPWVSDLTGKQVDAVGPEYWVQHMLSPVRFADGVSTLRALGCDGFVEIGPHPTLLGLVRTMTPPEDLSRTLRLPSLRRGGDDWEVFLQSMARLHCAGGAVDWSGLDAPHGRTYVPVPHAVFEQKPYWRTIPAQTADGDDDRARSAPAGSGAQRRENRVYEQAGPGAVGNDPAVMRDVVEYVSVISGFPQDQVSQEARLGFDLGFDSLMKTELERRIEKKYPQRIAELRRKLPDDPMIGELISIVSGGVASPAAAPAAPAPAPQRAPEPAPAPWTPEPAPTQWNQPAPAAPQWTPEPAQARWTPEPAPVQRAPEPAPVQRAPEPAPAPAAAAGGPEWEFDNWPENVAYQQRQAAILSTGENAYGRTHEGFNTGRIEMHARSVINFSAFNYLALSNHPRLIAAAKNAIDRYGTSSSATPLLCGETPLHHELDAEIASFLGTETAIVFAGGHTTNVATVGHLFGPDDLVVHDEWIHDSSVRGAMLAGARRRPFPHNDWQALDRMLGMMRGQYRRVVVVIEGAYSQDGDIPDLPRFIEVKKRHNAMLMIDEAHSIGVLGRTGRGIGEYWGVDRRDVDLWMGTLSKAIGSLGGYIAARRPIIEFMKATTPLFIFSTGISPANAAAALEAFRVIRDEPQRVHRVQQLADFFRAQAVARGFDIGVSRATPVIPVIIGNWERSMSISHQLLQRGVNVMPIGYPAVRNDQARLRFFVNADHREDDLVRSLDLLGEVMDGRTTSSSHTPAASTPSNASTGSTGSTASSYQPQTRLTGPVSAGRASVLVTGASGFIGGHVTRRLVEQGHQVRVLCRENSDRTPFADLDVEVEVGPLSNVDALRRATAGVTKVFNCTGMSADWGPWQEFQGTNVEGSRNLMEAAHHAGTVERFVHLSTTDVYGYPQRPCDETAELNDVGLPYNRSKIMGEIVVREASQRYGVPLTVIRPASVYGPRSKDFVVELSNLMLAKQMVYISRGDSPAGLLYVGNAADGMIAASNAPEAVGRAYNFRDPELTTWREYLEALAKGIGAQPPSMSLPLKVATGVATASEKLYGSLRIKSRPVLTRHAVNLFARDQSYPIDRARDDFGFKSAVDFETGMRLTIEWLDSAEGRRYVKR